MKDFQRPKLMEIQQKIWAYEWIEAALDDLHSANYQFWRALHYLTGALWCFYQAARRFWWAHKFRRM